MLPSKWKHAFRMKIVSIFSPAMHSVNKTTIRTKDNLSAWFHSGDVKRENKKLKIRIQSIEADLVTLEENKLENQRLRQLLQLKESIPEYQFIAAKVIGRDATNWYKSITIDKGLNNGIHRGDPVVSYGGVIGSVFECGNYQSKILLLNDNNSRVGVIVQRTRDIGVVEGQSNSLLVLNYIPRNSEIKPGDILISSGLGSIYPKGIVVGEIVKVFEEKYKLYKFAEVKPAVDFGKLEEVLIINWHDHNDKEMQLDNKEEVVKVSK